LLLSENTLVARLAKVERLQFTALCTLVPLPIQTVLAERGSVTRYVYFPTSGYVSLVEEIEGEPGLEVGLIGREGLLGAHVALNAKNSPQHALVQGSGEALRISSLEFKRALVTNVNLMRVVHNYLYVTMVQLASSAACMRFHQIEPRLARWLLMSQDRAGRDTFHMTHAFLGFMLGVRRVGVTSAASQLAERGLISYRRGELTVVNRSGLEKAACACYASDKAAYNRQFR
jgi:CRP-like cAMP-binding protein